MDFTFIFSIYLKFFFLMAPFFVVSMFISMTNQLEQEEKNALAIKTTIAIAITCLVLLFFGKYIFDLFGITLDAFRIGSGSLLFLTAVALMQGEREETIKKEFDTTVAIVPLAIPMTIGPGAIGALLVMSETLSTVHHLVHGIVALILAVGTVGSMLYFSSTIKRIVGRKGLAVLSKITALILSALAAQIVFTGIKNFLEL